jgi:serine-aspartate repeat-containing protein C/D/E
MSSTTDAPSITSDSSVADKQAYTSNAVDSLNANTSNNTDTITDAVSNDVNLETATRDQIDNAVVAETIKTDFSNPDYGLTSPFMTLAAVAPMSTASTDSTPTTFALNSTSD